MRNLLQETVMHYEPSHGETMMAGSGAFFALLVVIATVIVHIGFAWFVYVDAVRIREEDGRRLFGAPVLWGLATLLIGVFSATAYWLVHHSAIGHDAPMNRA